MIKNIGFFQFLCKVFSFSGAGETFPDQKSFTVHELNLFISFYCVRKKLTFACMLGYYPWDIMRTSADRL